MQLTLKSNIPFIPVQIAYQGRLLEIPSVLLDTGSATSILSSDLVADIGLLPSPDDPLSVIRGIGGSEVVFSKRIDFLQVADRRLDNFEIEIGGLDYGFEINGILGMNFLIAAGAVIDLDQLEIRFSA